MNQNQNQNLSPSPRLRPPSPQGMIKALLPLLNMITRCVSSPHMDLIFDRDQRLITSI